jgi:FHA domain
MAYKICPLCGYHNAQNAVRCSMCTLSFDLSAPYETLEMSALDDTVDSETVGISVPFEESIDDTSPPEPPADSYIEAGTETVMDLEGKARQIIEEYSGLIDGRLGSLQIQGTLTLTHQDSGTIFHVPHHKLSEVVIGRSKEHATNQPDVSLAALPDSHLVSRLHAILKLHNQILMLVDQGSKNGTFLNGQRLLPEQARIVRDKDIIRIGLISLKVSYQTH